MRNLTKWPRLLVSDSKVSEDLAAEIIIRTSNLHNSSNDHEFDALVCRCFGFEYLDYSKDYPPGHTNKIFSQMQAVRDELGILELEYLTNSQIASCYFGGPHGWIDWSGTIGCYEFNIGKWPSHETVLSEWKMIANAWPELNFRAQLVPDEGECDKAAVEYIIKDGRVKVIEDPGEKLKPSVPGSKFFGDDDLISVMADDGERGCTIEQLSRAIELCRNKNISTSMTINKLSGKNI
jgi:hypothetical protein